MSVRNFRVPQTTNFFGKNFILGYGAGAACGTILGLAKKAENPKINFKKTTKQYINNIGYTFGLASSLHNTALKLTKDIGNIESQTIAGAIAGAAIGCCWGIKGALGCALIGSALGASFGYGYESGHFDHILNGVNSIQRN